MTTLEFIQAAVILGLALFVYRASSNLKTSGKKKNNSWSK